MTARDAEPSHGPQERDVAGSIGIGRLMMLVSAPILIHETRSTGYASLLPGPTGIVVTANLYYAQAGSFCSWALLFGASGVRPARLRDARRPFSSAADEAPLMP
jgi:hypothetical protein